MKSQPGLISTKYLSTAAFSASVFFKSRLASPRSFSACASSSCNFASFFLEGRLFTLKSGHLVFKVVLIVFLVVVRGFLFFFRFGHHELEHLDDFIAGIALTFIIIIPWACF